MWQGWAASAISFSVTQIPNPKPKPPTAHFYRTRCPWAHFLADTRMLCSHFAPCNQSQHCALCTEQPAWKTLQKIIRAGSQGFIHVTGVHLQELHWEEFHLEELYPKESQPTGIAAHTTSFPLPFSTSEAASSTSIPSPSGWAMPSR